MIALFEKINYGPKNKELFEKALTHKSFLANVEGSSSDEHFEKLEFLGDAVLDLVMAEALMDQFPTDKEGNLSRKRASLVNEESLNRIAESLGVDEFIKVGASASDQQLRKNPRILASVVEAIIGAIYLDSGYTETKNIILKVYQPYINESAFEDNDFQRDYKTRFQEVIQEKYKVTPNYELKETQGPDHQKVFVYEVFVDGKNFGEGMGESKKEASQKAAQKGLEKLEKETCP